MIDNFALFLGHGLLAIALWRLVQRDGLDVDPLLDRYRAAASDRSRSRSNSGRRARARGGQQSRETRGSKQSRETRGTGADAGSEAEG